MAKLQGFKRIQTEDFPKEYQSIVDRLGYSINIFAEQVIEAFNKQISYDNLNRSYITLTTDVSVTGIPNDELIIKIPTNGFIGFNCVSAENLDDDTGVTGCPFLTYIRLSNGSIRITNIVGLPANKNFKLTVEILGT